MTLPASFAPLFTVPSFRTFCGLACGFLAQPGKRTVCGMLSGAGLSRAWSHDRAHSFFSRARWDPDELGLATARLVVSLLVPAGEPVLVAADDTLLRRRGKKAWAASWFHDGSAQGPAKTGRGNNWVVMAVIVRLPFCARPVALPVLAKLVVKGTNPASRLWLARRMTQMLADALPGRRVHVVADSAYAGEELRKLGKDVTWTTRLRKDAALHVLTPARVPGKKGRPRLRSDRLPSLAGIAAAATFEQVTVIALCARLLESLRDDDWSMERYEYVDTLERGLIQYNDELVNNSYISWSHYRLWNAVFRVWGSFIMPAGMRLNRAIAEFERDGDERHLRALEVSEYPGLWWPAPELKNILDLTTKSCEGYEAGQLTGDEAADAILAAIQGCDNLDDIFGWKDESRRFVYPTSAEIAKYVYWAARKTPDPELRTITQALLSAMLKKGQRSR